MAALILFALGACPASPPGEPGVRPKTTIEFDPKYDPKREPHRLLVGITTVGGTAYAVPVEVETNNTQIVRDAVLAELVRVNWLVEKTGDFGLDVFGVRGKGENSDPVKSLVVTARKMNGREIARLGAVGGAQVELREGDPKPAANPPSRGPNLGAEPFVEFDFTPVPCPNAKWALRVKAYTEKVVFSEVMRTDGIERARLCETFARLMLETGFKAEVLEKSKIRVYGHTEDGKFYPATHGAVESPDLEKSQLPKIENSKTKG